MGKLPLLSPNWNTFLRDWWAYVVTDQLTRYILIVHFIHASLPMQEATFLDRASAGQPPATSWVNIGIAAPSLIRMSYAWGRKVGDVFWERVLRADAAGIDRAGFSSFR